MNFLIATKKYLKNEIIINLGNNPAEENNPGRIQVSKNKFILPPKDIYHSCNPNARISWDSMNLVACDEILKGDIITYHYGTSEDDYRIGAFQCACGSPDCISYFQGFKYLNSVQRNRIKDTISPYLKNKYFR